MTGWCFAATWALAWRCGESSQQPTWPQDMHIRRCTQRPPMQAVLAALAARGHVGDLVQVAAGWAHRTLASSGGP